MIARLVAINPKGGDLPRELAQDAGAAYLTDESRLCGRAERIFFPRSEAELLAVLAAAQSASAPITVSGGRTGIVGGAVPEGGWLVSLEAMNKITGLRYDRKADCFHLRCQPGVALEALHAAVERIDAVNRAKVGIIVVTFFAILFLAPS